MTPSAACEALIKSFESCRLTAYLPTPNDVPTIGFGSTGHDVMMGVTWTQEQADARFDSDLANFAARVSDAAPIATQGQFDAMVSLAYNIGMGNFTASTLLRLHNAGHYDAVPFQFGRWVFQGKEILPGLIARRKAEAAMYQGEQT